MFASELIDFKNGTDLHSAPCRVTLRVDATCLKEGTMVAFEDKTLICRDCSSPFVFTAGEQGFYLEKGLLNEPQRCGACRANRRRERSNGGRTMTTVTCAGCGGDATVPFVPRMDRPVFCSNCFEHERASVAS
jgi:CxxC-x17-CxxC domain-containing protein